MVRTFGGGGSALDLDRQVDKTITTSQRPPAIPSKPRPLMLGKARAPILAHAGLASGSPASSECWRQTSVSLSATDHNTRPADRRGGSFMSAPGAPVVASG